MIAAPLNLPLPDGGPSWFTSLAYEEISRCEAKLGFLYFGEIHPRHICKVETVPLNIFISQIWDWPCASLALWRKHFAKLYVTDFVNLNDCPTRCIVPPSSCVSVVKLRYSHAAKIRSLIWRSSTLGS